ARAQARGGLRVAARRFDGGVAARCERVEAAAGTILARGNRRILPAAEDEPHALETRERAIQRAVRREQTDVLRLANRARDLVAVELGAAAAAQRGGGLADGELDGQQAPWSAAHAVIIGRYLRMSRVRAVARSFRVQVPIWHKTAA